MTTMRKLGVALALLVTLLFAGTLYYFMPRTTQVSITKTETKRMERKDPATGEWRSRDVWLVIVKDLDADEPRVFRNEDNGWYFKLDSGNIAAQASQFAKDHPQQPVRVKHYGVRIPFLDWYPNILSLEEVDPKKTYVPWGNITFLIVLLMLFLWAGVKVRHLFGAAKAKLSKRPDAS
jgi:hypothetical protein